MTLRKETFDKIGGKGENAGEINVFYPFKHKYQFFIHIYFCL